jgi:DNA-binding protein YbaB
LLVDLPRLTTFTTFYRDHSDLFRDRPPTEISFLPDPMPKRPLQAEDLEWRTLVASREKFQPFKPTDGQLDQLRKLKREAKAAFEYGSRIMRGGGVLEKGRPCFSRINLLVNRDKGMVLGFDLTLATIPFAECAGAGLVKTLVNGGFLPGKVLIDDSRLAPILGVLCDVLKMDLVLSADLDALAEAQASLENYMGR